MTRNKQVLMSFCSFILILTFVISLTPQKALAASHGIYTAISTSHYIHPVTGVIEDSGNNVEIGQAMTESALHKTALIEVDSNGKHYATIRFNLMDNISNFSFKVQKDGSSAFRDVSSTIVKEDLGNNRSDFRFEIPSEKAIVRTSFYVGPMGRDVVFYITFSGLKAGSADFVTHIKIEETTQPTTQETTKVSEPKQTDLPAQSTDNNTQTQPSTTTNAQNNITAETQNQNNNGAAQITEASDNTSIDNSDTAADIPESSQTETDVSDDELANGDKSKTNQSDSNETEYSDENSEVQEYEAEPLIDTLSYSEKEGLQIYQIKAQAEQKPPLGKNALIIILVLIFIALASIPAYIFIKRRRSKKT